MTERWYYAHDANKQGPFSGRELRDLADAGQILPTDTVWKEDVEQGVLARRIKNLFTAAPPVPLVIVSAPLIEVPSLSQPSASTPSSANLTPAVQSETLPPAPAANPEEATDHLAPAPLPDHIVLQPEWTAPEPLPKPSSPPKHVRKGRAVGSKGAIIVGQDGTHVKFRKKCMTCGYEEATRNSLKITNGLTRVPLFCPKCRKRREVEIQGVIS